MVQSSQKSSQTRLSLVSIWMDDCCMLGTPTPRSANSLLTTKILQMRLQMRSPVCIHMQVDCICTSAFSNDWF